MFNFYELLWPYKTSDYFINFFRTIEVIHEDPEGWCAELRLLLVVKLVAVGAALNTVWMVVDPWSGEGDDGQWYALVTGNYLKIFHFHSSLMWQYLFTMPLFVFVHRKLYYGLASSSKYRLMKELFLGGHRQRVWLLNSNVNILKVTLKVLNCLGVFFEVVGEFFG